MRQYSNLQTFPAPHSSMHRISASGARAPYSVSQCATIARIVSQNLKLCRFGSSISLVAHQSSATTFLCRCLPNGLPVSQQPPCRRRHQHVHHTITTVPTTSRKACSTPARSPGPCGSRSAIYLGGRHALCWSVMGISRTASATTSYTSAGAVTHIPSRNLRKIFTVSWIHENHEPHACGIDGALHGGACTGHVRSQRMCTPTPDLSRTRAAPVPTPQMPQPHLWRPAGPPCAL